MNSYKKRMLSNIKIVVLGIFIVCPQGNAIKFCVNFYFEVFAFYSTVNFENR